MRKKRDIWAAKNKIGHNFEAQKSFICSEHFTTDDYDQGYLLKKKLMPDCKQAPTLKHDAIPSINLPSSSSRYVLIFSVAVFNFMLVYDMSTS